MKKSFLVMIIVLLIASLFFNELPETSTVYADLNQRGIVTASSLNVREQPSTSAAIIGSLSKNTEVELYEKTGSWYKIRINNRWGYIHGDYVKVTQSSSSSSASNNVIGTGEITATRLNVREKASTSANIIGSLQKGSKVSIYEKSGQWYKVKIGSSWGYIHGDYVKYTSTSSNSGSNSGSSNSGSSITSQVIGSGEVTATRLNVREKASTSANIIGSLQKGSKVSIFEKSGQWYKVKIGSSWGYIHGDYVKYTSSSSNSGSSSSTSQVIGSGEVTATRLNVRESASTSARIISSLTKGQKVDLHEKSGKWYKIKVGSSWGYIHGDYLKVTQANSSSGNSTIGKGEITASKLNIREKPNTSAKVIGTLDRGKTVELYEKTGDWYKIKQGSSWGYIHSSYVKLAGSNNNTGNIQLSGKTIFLDPGHGGKDPGATVGSVRESDLALAISNTLKKKLEAAGAKVVTSRGSNVFISLGDRVTKANQSGADIFISIHMNSHSSSSASGVEVFYNEVNAGANSRKLANAIQQQMTSSLSLNNRGTKVSNFQVIRYTTMPAVLAELGFMTNTNDLRILSNEQDKITDALLIAIDNYFK
nr:SH3 domain-containing protein [Evansella caseinilytica]